MAWEWVQPVATSTGTAIVGVAGIVATLKAGNRQAKVAIDVARQQGDAQVATAREERQQRRLEASYMELLTALSESRVGDRFL